MSQDFKNFEPIDKNHFKKSYNDQLSAHNNALEYLKQLNFSVEIISPTKTVLPSFAEASKFLDETSSLDSTICGWENTDGISDDIQNSAKQTDQIHIYGVASQFNGSEAMSRYTIEPGQAYIKYMRDPTQGPRAQIQFPKDQVESLNVSANKGFNGLIHLLDEKTKTSVRHGYFTPDSKEAAETLIERIRMKGSEMLYVAAGGIPEAYEWKSKSKAKWNTERIPNTEVVHEMLVAAPAFGMYSLSGSMTPKQKDELEYLCAARAMQAQLRYAVQLRQTSSVDKKVILRPTAPGLGVFGNKPKNVAVGFYVALKEFQDEILSMKNLEVRLQVYGSRGAAMDLANHLQLKKRK